MAGSSSTGDVVSRMAAEESKEKYMGAVSITLDRAIFPKSSK